MSASSMVIGIDGRTRGHDQVAGSARVRATRPEVTASSPLRLTRRGRLVVTLVLTCLIVAAFVVAGGASVATREGGAAEAVRIVEVEQGQTLWQIAASVAAPGETGEMVYRIRELNSLPGSGLVEGQELAVPLP
jgi:hypothetical protein